MQTGLPISLIIWLALTTGRGAAQGPQAMDLEHCLLMTPKEGIALLPAEVICGPEVRRMSFSGSGRYLLIERKTAKLTSAGLADALAGRKPPPLETSILMWDSKTRECQTVWKAAGEAVHVQELAWLPGTDVAVALADDTQRPIANKAGAIPRAVERQVLLRIVPGAERAQVIAGAADAEQETLSLSVSPVRPLAILNRLIIPRVGPAGTPDYSSTRHEITLVGDDARLGRSLQAAPDYRFYEIDWTADGAPILNGVIRRGKERPVPQRLLLDPKSCTFTVYAKEPEPPVVRNRDASISATLGIRLKPGTATVKEGDTTRPVHPLWVESIESTDAPRALVAADAYGGQFSPTGDAILFQSQNTLMAVPLARIDKETLAAARAAAKRMEALNKGKQLGLAAFMYAQDHDETLPSGDDINSKISPYLQNPSLLDGFSYTHSGGPLKDIEKPAETEMGFVTGPGGRAIIYCDGHVKWKND